MKKSLNETDVVFIKELISEKIKISSYEDFFTFDASVEFASVEFALKKDIVSRFKELTVRKKYSKISFKDYFNKNGR